MPEAPDEPTESVSLVAQSAPRSTSREAALRRPKQELAASVVYARDDCVRAIEQIDAEARAWGLTGAGQPRRVSSGERIINCMISSSSAPVRSVDGTTISSTRRTAISAVRRSFLTPTRADAD